MSDKTVWRKAYDLIDLNGHTKGSAESAGGCFCVAGAIAKVVTGDPEEMWSRDRPVLRALFERFADHVGVEREYNFYGEIIQISPETRVYDWNDDSLRTKEDVLKALEELDELEKGNK